MTLQPQSRDRFRVGKARAPSGPGQKTKWLAWAYILTEFHQLTITPASAFFNVRPFCGVSRGARRLLGREK